MLRYVDDYLGNDPIFELWASDPIELAIGDTVSASLRKPDGSIVNRACTILYYGNGVVAARASFPLANTDLDQPGSYTLELEVTYAANGRTETCLEPVDIYVRPRYTRGRR